MRFLHQLKIIFTPNYKEQHPRYSHYRSLWHIFHIDIILLLSILAVTCYGFFILYSASNQNFHYVKDQALHIGIASIVMFGFAQIPPHTYQRWSPWIYGIGIALLLAVLVMGHFNKGAQRWLGLGVLRFQPSEIMKLALPMMVSLVLSKHPLPVKNRILLLCFFIIIIPVLLTAKQPDLGTAILLTAAGLSALFIAGIPWHFISIGSAVAILLTPILWLTMHDYQRERVLTFLNPERDPLGSGYHIIQSKIAIGSGGLTGKGWLLGTQSHLNFLPEHSTDFIFAVCGEEFGFVGAALLMLCYLAIILRGGYITLHASDCYSKILAGSLTLTLFISIFINMGMVTGILPVVGVPLPLISYGGTSLVTLMASFGILMSIHTHKKVVHP